MGTIPTPPTAPGKARIPQRAKGRKGCPVPHNAIMEKARISMEIIFTPWVALQRALVPPVSARQDRGPLCAQCVQPGGPHTPAPGHLRAEPPGRGLGAQGQALLRDPEFSRGRESGEENSAARAATPRGRADPPEGTRGLPGCRAQACDPVALGVCSGWRQLRKETTVSPKTPIQAPVRYFSDCKLARCFIIWKTAQSGEDDNVRGAVTTQG